MYVQAAEFVFLQWMKNGYQFTLIFVWGLHLPLRKDYMDLNTDYICITLYKFIDVHLHQLTNQRYCSSFLVTETVN